MEGRVLRTDNCKSMPMKHGNEGLSTLEPKWLEQDTADVGHWMWKQCQRMVCV